MKVTKPQVVTVVGFIVSSLLIFTASCSPEKKTPVETTLKQTKTPPQKSKS